VARKKTSAQQPSLFKRDIPPIPEGYYSSGPNPNLRRFAEEHATPYDPEADDYHVPPFDQPITTTKATAIYNMHTYWSKKPHDAIRQYIRHYTQPGDIVLDPMCGSGGTALAALMEDRAAIAIDLSPAATFITKNYCTPVDVEELQRAFEELQARVKPEMDWLYETRCDRCDGRATTGYTVYSYVFQCARCLEKVPLFDCVKVEKPGFSEKPGFLRACPHCYARGHVEEISTSRNQRFDPLPVLVSYLCEEGCKPKRAERRHNDADPKKRDFFEKYDLGKLQEIEAREIPYWYPPHRMMNVESDTEPWGDEWRPGRDFRTVAELFTKRNLWALAAFLDAIKLIGNDALLFAFQSNILSASIMQQYREAGGGFAKGTYYVPQIFIEREQWGCLRRKVSDVIKGKAAIDELTSTQVHISTQSAIDMSDISSNTVDYVFTDPPYAGSVQYGELNFVWEAWMDFDTQWHSNEIIINITRGVTDADWARMMQQAMSECYRVLKPGRWISLCYHDTSEGTWQLVQDLMTEVGFIPESTEAALYIDTGQKSFNQLMAEKVTRRDLVINFRKPRPGELVAQLTLFGDEDAATFAEKARTILHEALEAHPGSSADRLYDELVSRMVRKGEFERHNFDQLLRSVAEDARGDGRWYLLETADQVDEAESAKETAAAARLEAYINRVFAEKPGLSGVHYSDLFEQYLPVGDKPRRLMQDWLPEYFFRTPEGTWRPPVTDEERAQKEALRASGTLRQIKRFAKALLEGVPPHDRDRPANTATAADWIRQCRRAGLYELGRALYEKGGFSFGELGDEGQLEVEEDYQVCVRRSG
jgi:SAM-dependent methyltransferase